ncbi:hypothetical protein BSK71_19625 [Pectobacterium actinidiae]|uniref:Uncharacterized protein n=1 Tax=Pectobacterium actinidiae TaxID=1507808 RepID=A0A1V2QZU1_9GAMM|nr:hypothetical protein BSK71_19625 [Pectobacterium actinidiae]
MKHFLIIKKLTVLVLRMLKEREKNGKWIVSSKVVHIIKTMALILRQGELEGMVRMMSMADTLI